MEGLIFGPNANLMKLNNLVFAKIKGSKIGMNLAKILFGKGCKKMLVFGKNGQV